MSSNRKVFLSVLGMLMAGCAANVSAQVADPAVLFKIHDVQPVKNSDGLTIACDFDTTLYNRSDKDINSATLSLTWTDTAIEGMINEEKKVDPKMQNNYRGSFSQTEASSPSDVVTTVDVPALKPYKQVSLRSRIQSDRCFLLMNDVRVEVKKCQIAGGQESGRNSTPCDGMFRFVSPQNPEYYREFKPISYDEVKMQGENKRNQDRRDLNVQYDATIAEINKVGQVLEGIKSDVADADAVTKEPAKVQDVSEEVLSAKLQTLFPGIKADGTSEVQKSETVETPAPEPELAPQKEFKKPIQETTSKK